VVQVHLEIPDQGLTSACCVSQCGSVLQWQSISNTHAQKLLKLQTLFLDSGVLCSNIAEHCNAFLRPLKGFKEERVTKIGLYAIGKSTTLESNKSHDDKAARAVVPF
jgi:hypothetical protein